jgi:hypothetical protein
MQVPPVRNDFDHREGVIQPSLHTLFSWIECASYAPQQFASPYRRAFKILAVTIVRCDECARERLLDGREG